MTADEQLAANATKNEPVNRSRRSYFIFFVVSFCLFVSAAFTALGAFGMITTQMDLVKLLVEALVGLAGIATVAYVGGSSLDYNGGLGNMFSRNQNSDPYRNANYTQAEYIEPVYRQERDVDIFAQPDSGNRRQVFG